MTTQDLRSWQSITKPRKRRIIACEICFEREDTPSCRLTPRVGTRSKEWRSIGLMTFDKSRVLNRWQKHCNLVISFQCPNSSFVLVLFHFRRLICLFSWFMAMKCQLDGTARYTHGCQCTLTCTFLWVPVCVIVKESASQGDWITIAWETSKGKTFFPAKMQFPKSISFLAFDEWRKYDE